MQDIRDKFDLSLIIWWKNDEASDYLVLPNYRAQWHIEMANREKQRLIVHRLGTQQNFWDVAEHGAQMTPWSTYHYGSFLKREFDLVPDLIQNCTAIWLEEVLNNPEVQWGQMISDRAEQLTVRDAEFDIAHEHTEKQRV
jgi:hypothetical protein